MNGRKNIILEQKVVHSKNHKKFLTLLSYFWEKKEIHLINLTSNKTNTFKEVYRILKKDGKGRMFLQGSPDTIKKQYEFLSDIIRDCNGKVHGSQSHISNNSMYLIVYYEVPEGQRDDVNKKIDNFAQYKNEMACSRIR